MGSADSRPGENLTETPSQIPKLRRIYFSRQAPCSPPNVISRTCKNGETWQLGGVPRYPPGPRGLEVFGFLGCGSAARSPAFRRDCGGATKDWEACQEVRAGGRGLLRTERSPGRKAA